MIMAKECLSQRDDDGTSQSATETSGFATERQMDPSLSVGSNDVYCAICNMPLYSRQQYEDHCLGKKHKR